MPRLLWLTLPVLLAACPNTDEGAVRVGVDRALEELGLAAYLAAAYEARSKEPVRLVYGDTDQLRAGALDGRIDHALVMSERTMNALEMESIPIRAETYAHEELVFIGPFQDYLGRHSDVGAVDLLKNIARTGYRYLKGKEGSIERDRHALLFELGKDRGEPGAFFETELSGVELVKAAIERQAFALVRRSSVLLAAKQGFMPHRLYKEGDPELVLRLRAVEIHPAKTGRARRPGFYDFLFGEEGKVIVAEFGKAEFGYPLYAPGEPEAGQGARVPGVEAGLKRE